MLKIFIILVWCQTGLQSVSCNDQHDPGFLLQCDSSCTLPEFPGNGRYTVLGALADTHPGALVPNSTIIQYNCDVDFILYSHSTAVCIDGTWDTQFTKCQRKVTCPLPTNPAHGSYELSDLGGPFVHGTDVPNWSTAIYSCDATFEIVGNRTALCYNGLWTTEPHQCQSENAPAKGSYSILGSQDAPVAGLTVQEFQILKYDCPAPNILQGIPVIYCQNGNWLPEIPRCFGNTPCTLPAIPMNAGINAVQDVDPSLPGIQVPSLSNIEYSCDATFELIGTANISCNDGSWSSEPPQCQKTTACVVPGAPTEGSYSIPGSQDAPVAGSIVEELKVLKYDCPAPNIFQGSPVIYCGNGNWLPEVPSCSTTKPCTVPAVSVNARINAVQDVNPSHPGIQVPSLSNIEYFCDATFELIGIASISCYDGLWSSEHPQCQRITNCILPDLPVRGTYSIVGSVKAPVPGAAIAEKEVLRYNCGTKYRGPTDQVIVCSGGKWLPGVVECDPPSDCGDVLCDTSGVYVIQPTSNTEPFDVCCDLTLAGQKWTVIQQRFNEDIDFYRSYTEYSAGFGPKTGNHWLGLEHIHEITKGGHYELYVELEAHNGTKAYARYETFIVGSSSTGFQMTISGYSGTASDSMYNTPYSSTNLNGMKFSTYDKDQDKSSPNCAERLQGGWWYKSCSYSNLNGPYKDTADYDNGKSMYWVHNFDWYALKTSRMLIRRK